MTTLMEAIQWKWPGACCVIQGETVIRWDGPMPRPTDAEIAQAYADYVANAAALAAEREGRAHADQRATAALAWVLLRRLFPNDTVAQTKTKHAILREDVVTAYKAEPWR